MVILKKDDEVCGLLDLAARMSNVIVIMLYFSVQWVKHRRCQRPMNQT